MNYLLRISFGLCLMLLACPKSFSQKSAVYIPYRVGNLWGVSDTSGKIVLKPAYDAIYLSGESHPASYQVTLPEPMMLAMKNGKCGVVSDREIIPTKFDWLYSPNGDYFLTVVRSDQQGRPRKSMYDARGRCLIPEGYDLNQELNIHEVSSVKGSIPEFVYLLLLSDSAGRKHVLVAEASRARIDFKWLLKDLYSANVATSSGRLPVTLRIRKDGSGSMREEQTIMLNQDGTGYELASPPNETGRYGQSGTIHGFGTGSGSGRIEAERDDAIAIPEPAVETKEAQSAQQPLPKKLPVVHFRYMVKDEALILYRSDPQGRIVGTQEVPAPKGLTGLKILYTSSIFNYRDTLQDTIRVFGNWIFGKQGNQTAIYFAHDLPGISHDSLLMIRQYDGSGARPLFLYGDRKSDGSIPLGFLDAQGRVQVAAQYDSVNLAPLHQLRYGKSTSDVESNWLIYKKGQTGLSDRFCKLILPVEYDQIRILQQHSGYSLFQCTLKGMHQVLLLPVGSNPLLSNLNRYLLTTDYPASGFILRGRRLLKNASFILVMLQDANGVRKGFVSMTGRKYYREH